MTKSLSLTDIDKLKRFMMITMTSEHIGEKANAVSLANNLLKKSNLTWDDVFARSITAVQDTHYSGPRVRDPFPDEEYVDMAEVRREQDWRPVLRAALDELRGTVKGSFGEMIEDLDAKMAKDNYLSQAQRSTVMKALGNKRRWEKERR